MASTDRPTRRSTSARVRTVVVFPVPPFRDRTAIVSAMRGRDLSERSVPDGGRGGRAARADGGVVEEVDGVAADRDLVAVLERRPVDPPAVDMHAVEGAVVEDPHAVGLRNHERMTARDGGVVEADVGRQRAPDARPLARDGGDDAAARVLVREVLARNGQLAAGRLDPVGTGGRGRLCGLLGERYRALAADGQRSGRVDFAGRAWIHVFLLWRAPRAVPSDPTSRDE